MEVNFIVSGEEGNSPINISKVCYFFIDHLFENGITFVFEGARDSWTYKSEEKRDRDYNKILKISNTIIL